MRFTANDMMVRIDGFNAFIAAYEAQEEVRQLFWESLQRAVTIISPHNTATQFSMGTNPMLWLPIPELINVVERNLDTLSSSGYRPTGMQQTRNWLGETHDTPRLDFNDVNRWFITIEQLKDLINSILHRGLITGNYGANTSVGAFRTHQILRLVK